MRMRKKKHGAERIAALSYLLIDPECCGIGKRPVSEVFRTPAPVQLEIGCGKGGFILAMAKKHPELNFIAMERVSDVILSAMEGCAREDIPNIRFINADARILKELFSPGEIDTLYLNFSDPWPKKGYAKRRLTHENFLMLYREILPEGGKIIFKTDNAALFDFSLEEFEKCGFSVSELTRDLHNSAWNAENLETEYEKNFSAKGFPIHRCVATVCPLPQPKQPQ